MTRLTEALEARLKAFCLALIDQPRARPVIAPQRDEEGYWFGGGNMIAGEGDRLYLTGRFRNHGDSRTGLRAGQRGWELAIYESADHGATFEKRVAFSKQDLSVGERAVLSIEGSALWRRDDGEFELFVSSEKEGIDYPDGWAAYLKPGAGVWTIDCLRAPSLESLPQATPQPLLASQDPCHLHVKDPFVWRDAAGHLWLLFSTHPYCWSSSNTAYAVRRAGRTSFEPPCFDFFPRGTTWDVAITRGTAVLPVPRVGPFRDHDVSLLFYDGGESLRNLDEHERAVRRPRGYSCEELGGAAYFTGTPSDGVHRISKYQPLFVSPTGTGCSRYVDVLETAEGYYASWQQSQPGGAQPLVLRFLSRAEAERILS